MNEAVKSSILLSMSESLDNKELGAAVRLLLRILEKKTAIPLRGAHISAGVSKEEWNDIKEDVLFFFKTTETHVSVTGVLDTTPSIASEPQKTRKGKTTPLFPETEYGDKISQLPNYLIKKEKPITVKQAVYDTGIRLFIGNGMTERMARSVVSNFLKTYEAGDVAAVFDQARKEEELSDPHSWIVAQLRRKAQQAKTKQRGARGSIHILPESMAPVAATKQMSEETAEEIRKRNLALSRRSYGAKASTNGTTGE